MTIRDLIVILKTFLFFWLFQKNCRELFVIDPNNNYEANDHDNKK